MTKRRPTISAGGMLLFYRPRGPGVLVSLLTRSPYYHVAIVVDPKHVVEAMPNGVIQSDLQSKRGEHFVFIPPPSKSSGEKAVRWAKGKIGDGYDPKDLVAIVLNRMFGILRLHFVTGDRFTCAEFVATAFKRAGHDLFPSLDPEDVMPRDFARLLRRKAAKAKP